MSKKHVTLCVVCFVMAMVAVNATAFAADVPAKKRGLGVRQYAKWSFAWSGPGFEKQPIPDNVLMLEAR